jgi:hypothetical protein
MKLAALLLLLAPISAFAYTPEALIEKVAPLVPEIPSPGAHQYLNPFTQVQVGYERPDFGKEENEFSLSLEPKSLSEASSYKAYASSLTRDAEVSRKLLRSQALRTAYSALISAALAKERSESMGELNDLLNKSQKLSEIEARLSRDDVKNVLKANSDLQKSLGDLIDSESEIAGIRKFLSTRGLKLGDLETTDIIGPDEIEARLAALPKETVALSAKKIQSSLDVARSEARHSTAKRSKLLDEVKLSMKEDKKEQAYKLEVTFNLPFLAAQNLDDYKDAMKAATAEVESRQAMLEESLQSAGLAEVLKRKISFYRAMGDGHASVSASILRQDPALALELKRSSVALRLTKASLLAEIRTLYVDLLLETEALADQPQLNHLSKAGRKI